MLHVGGKVSVYSRLLTVVAYADQVTEAHFGSKMSSTVGYVLPGDDLAAGVRKAAALFSILEMRMVHLSPQEAAAAFGASELAAKATGGPLLAMKLAGADAVAAAAAAGIAASADSAAAEAEERHFFGGGLAVPALTSAETSSLLVVRPHAVKKALVGDVLAELAKNNFSVLALQMLQLTRPNAVEFLEVYKGVVPEYTDWVNELVGGRCVAMQVTFNDAPENSVPALRQLCGAHDPEIASHLHPHSLRALYGSSKVENCVHCTDLPEDGPLEVEYFFAILPHA